MTQSFSLPPDCLLRPACAADKPLIRKLLNQFRQEMLPNASLMEWLLRGSLVGLMVGFIAVLAISFGWQRMISLLAGPTIVVGIGLLIVLVFTWNEDWENFWVIEHNSAIVACAKLRRTSRYSLLHDLYVLPEWRSQGLGSYLVHSLGSQAAKPLYLTCLPRLAQFYLRLGFIPVSANTLSPLLQFDLGLPGRLEVMPLVLR